MPITAQHSFTSPLADGTNTQLVRPSNWNASHLITFTPSGTELIGAFSNDGNVTFGTNTAGYITATAPSGGGGAAVTYNLSGNTEGSSQVSGNPLYLQGGNNVTLSGTSNTIVVSAANQTVDTRKAGTGFTSTTTAGTAVVATQGTDGLSMGVPAYLTTAALSQDSSKYAGTGFTSTTTAGTAVVGTLGTNGLSVGVPTIVTNAITTARASNDAVGLNTALTAGPLAWTVDSRGISLNASSAAGTTSGFTGGASISGSMTHNTAGLALSLSHPAWITTQSNQAFSASGGSSAFQTLGFSNQNGVTFTNTNGSVGITHDLQYTSNTSNITSNALNTSASKVAGIVAGTNQTAGTATLTGNVSFSNANGVSFYTSAGNAIVASVAAAGGAQTGISSVVVSNTTYTSGQISFSQGNGVSFASGAGQAISVTHDLQYTSNTSNITANALNTSASRVINIVAATNNTGGGTASLSSNVSFSNVNGATFYTSAGGAVALSYSVPTVPTAYVSSVNGSSGAISFATGSSLSSSQNGSTITWGLASNITTALQSTGNYLTTARASNDAIGLNTAQSNVTWTVNSSGLSLDARGYAGTGTTTGATNASVTANLNSNGLALSVSVGAGGGVTSGNIYATGNTTQTTSNTVALSSLVFEGAGIASVGVSNNRVLVSVPSGGGAGDGVNIIQAGTTGTTGTTFSSISGTVFLNGSNNVIVSQNNSNQLVIDGSRMAGTGFTSTTTAGTAIVATQNSAGLSMGVPAFLTAAGGGGGIAASISGNSTSGGAGYSNITSGTMILAGGDNITLSQNGASISIQGNQPGGAGVSTGGSTVGSTGLATGQLVLAGINGIVLSQSTSSGSATISIYPDYESHWQNYPFLWTAAANVPSPIRQSTSMAFPVILDGALSINRMRFIRSIALGTTQVATVANTSWGFTQNETHNFVFYSQGTGANSLSLQSFTSTSVGLSMTVQGSVGAASNNLSVWHSVNAPNATGTSQFTVSTAPAGSASLPFASTAMSNFITGLRVWETNAALSLPAGEYWVIHGVTSTGTTGGATAASALTAATLAMSALGMPSINSNIASFGTSAQSFNQIYANLGGSFTTAGGGTTGSLNITQMSSWASHQVPYFYMERIA